MAHIESYLRSPPTLGPPQKKRKTQDGTSKKTLLEALKDVEDEIKTFGHNTLQKRLETLRGQVKAVLENQENEIKILRGDIESLKEEMKELKVKHDKLAVAQATWLWEAHVARFVVKASQRIYPIAKFNQMQNYLKKNPSDDRWIEIERTLTDWTDEHKELVKIVRDERNSVAHPGVTDLELVEREIEKTMSPESQKLMKDMLDMLKMTASLMKFGRLANFYNKNKHLFPTPEGSGEEIETRALNHIISWDRNFDQINGLQSVEHTKAKEYLDKYVNRRRITKPYFFIVDLIKEGNRKRLGKLAWNIEASGILRDLSSMYGEVIEELKKLLPNPDDESEVLDETIAKLHVPDFVRPEHLWKYGMEIIENYFKLKKPNRSYFI